MQLLQIKHLFPELHNIRYYSEDRALLLKEAKHPMQDPGVI